METVKLISLILMAAFYVFAGYNHFKHPKFYKKITPPLLKPYHDSINFISGAGEILLGILLLIPATSTYAAWGVIALLIAVFPANIYHLTSKGAGMKVKMWMLWLRIPIQFVFFAWAYWHTF